MGTGLVGKARCLAYVDVVINHLFWATVILIVILGICRVLKFKKSGFHTQLLHNLEFIPSKNLLLCGRDRRGLRLCLYLKVMFEGMT